MSYLYFTIKDIIDANLKARAIEKIKLPKKPEIVLFSCKFWYVLGSGLLVTVMVIGLAMLTFMRDWATIFGMRSIVVGDLVFTKPKYL